MASARLQHIIGLIPARWGSSRFPGKPLHPIAGKPLVQHVWERVARCSRLDDMAIATDDERILGASLAFGAKAIMTSPGHPSGSDRLAEAVQAFPSATHIVNIQGDEPLIDPALIDRLADVLATDPALPMATVACPIDREEDLDNPNIVKVVLAGSGDALYFPGPPSHSPAIHVFPRPSGILAFMPTAGTSLQTMSAGNLPPWNSRNPWNNCAHWKMGPKSESS